MPELHIVLQPAPTRTQWYRVGLAVPMIIVFLLNLDDIMSDSSVFMYIILGHLFIAIGVIVYRVYYLKRLFLRIGAQGIAWRLLAEMELRERTKPKISEGEHTWTDIDQLRHEAAGIRFTADDDEYYIPLRDFSYVQRQDIKRALLEFGATEPGRITGVELSK